MSAVPGSVKVIAIGSGVPSLTALSGPALVTGATLVIVTETVSVETPPNEVAVSVALNMPLSGYAYVTFLPLAVAPLPNAQT